MPDRSTARRSSILNQSEWSVLVVIHSCVGLLIDMWSRFQPQFPRGSIKPDDSASVIGTQVEMVTVPVLGPEWKTSELHEMSGNAKKERKAESRSQRYKQWRRGQRGFCVSWCTWRFTVFFVFALCIMWVTPPDPWDTSG
jgi:hypothetical protein